MRALEHIHNADIAADVLAAEHEFLRKGKRARWEDELSRDGKASEERGRELDCRVAQRLGLLPAEAPIEISAPVVSQRRIREGSRA